jgi:glycosyltransferase involved in cell wall biosynthesis
VRVGVDATIWANKRGYGRFARNAVTRLIELDPETTYVLYIDQESAQAVELPTKAEQRTVALGGAPSRAAAATSNRRLGDLLRMTRAVRTDELDCFLFPSVYTYFPVSRVPTVVGVHDVIADDFAGLTLPTRRARLLWWLKEYLAVRRATRLFTVSEASRTAISGRFGLAPEDVAIVPEAPDPVFRPRTDVEIDRELPPLGLEPGGSFLLFAGGISPHKNIDTLLDAYAALRRSGQELPVLVLVGELERDPFFSATDKVRERITQLGLERQVRLPGFVSDEALACLYSGATAVVLPSLAEGFGLPAVEAAACGAPVVLSDLPAHRETLGAAGLFFPPTDVGALTRALERVITDEEVRVSLGEGARKAVAHLSWDTSAERLRELIVAANGR